MSVCWALSEQSGRYFGPKKSNKWKIQSYCQIALEWGSLGWKAPRCDWLIRGAWSSIKAYCRYSFGNPKEKPKKQNLKLICWRLRREHCFSYQSYSRLQNDVHVRSSFNVAGQRFEINSFWRLQSERASRRLQPKTKRLSITSTCLMFICPRIYL